MRINKPDLLPALESVAQIATKRTTLPVLNCVLIQGVNNSLTIRASDLEQEESAAIPCIGDLLATCISARIFLELVRAANGEMEMQSDGKSLTVKGAGEAKIACIGASDFPPPIMDKFKAIGLNTNDLADGIDAVKWAQSDDIARFIYNSIHVVTSDTQIMCEATTGKQLGQFIRQSIAAKSETLIGSSFVSRLADVLRNKDATLSLGERYLKVSSANGEYFCKTMDEKYPNTSPIVNTERRQIGKIIPESFLAPLGICRLLIPENKTGSVKLEFDSAGAHLTLNGQNEHRYSETISGKFSEAKFCLGLETLTECLKSFKSDEVAIEMGCKDPKDDKFSPIVLSDKELTAITTQMIQP